MELKGRNYVGRQTWDGEGGTFQGYDPIQGRLIEPTFQEADPAIIDAAAEHAQQAFHTFREKAPAVRAAFLRRIAEEIEALGETLISRAALETALAAGRLQGERARTTGQLRMFARLVDEGSWVDARIDTAIPARAPLPKPDIRRMLVPLGPVAVFGASNFPLAFSVAGGDTASALAAGCPVVFKAHPAHPGTSEMVTMAILRAIESSGMPDGVFSLLHGTGPEVGQNLVRHPSIQAVGFTGSLRAGRSLFDSAAAREVPIPVYAEMGSVNPVFLLRHALEERGEIIASGMAASITLGTGQFCTNPGLIVGIDGKHLDRFAEALAGLVRESPGGNMLYPGLCHAYQGGIERLERIEGVERLAGIEKGDAEVVFAAVFRTDAATFLSERELQDEVFGPSSLLVSCKDEEELELVARSLQGQLTATLHATGTDLQKNSQLISLLQDRVGRIIVNGYPTGVEVCPSMHHGGPYPASTDIRSTSVGTAAVLRFARPISFQNFPDDTLPEALRRSNPLGIWRLLDGELTKATG